jgi:hypothetical protein
LDSLIALICDFDREIDVNDHRNSAVVITRIPQADRSVLRAGYRQRNDARVDDERAVKDGEWEFVRGRLAGAGVDPSDFGRLVAPDVHPALRPSSFDYRAATPVLLECLGQVSDPKVLEAIVRSLSGKWARGVAVAPLIGLFRRTSNDDWALKWAIGNALSVVARPGDLPEIYELAIDREHAGRGMLVGMLWRVRDPDPVPELRTLAGDPDCAFNAMAALRRKVSASEARLVIEPLLSDPDVRVRNAARENLKRIDKRLRQEEGTSR